MKKNHAFLVLVVTAGIVASFGWGASVHAQTVGVTLPSVPTGVSAAISPQPLQVAISWSASTESSGTIEGYYVYRNGGLIATTAGTSIVDGNLQPGLYSYTVAAYDANGYTSAQSSPPSTVTLIAETTPPTTPTGIVISGATSTNSIYAPVTLTISWSPSSDNIGVLGYDVYRDRIAITSGTTPLAGTSITDTVPPGTYTYTVVAYDAAQNFSATAPASVTVSIDNVSPSTPTNVSLQQISAGSVDVSWASSTDPAGIAGYQVFQNGIQVATATGSPYTDSGLTIGAVYSYRIAAYDVAGNVSNQSAPPVSVTIQPANGPGTPYAISARLLGTSTVALSWPAAVDSLTITGYSIYRDGAQVGTVTSTAYLDSGLAPGLHAYNLTATDVSGAVSPMSATSSIIVPIPTLSASSSTTLPANSVVPTSIVVVANSSTVSTASSIASLTQSLYYGLRNAQVTALQSFLVQNGYLAPAYATGFFGSLTQGAVEKFQCSENIVCTGGAGWGMVGPKTRNILNTLMGGSTVSTDASTSALTAELQMLEAELASLEARASK